MIIGKYPPIQGGVSADTFWFAQSFIELGHDVTVITNAMEVEDEYKISLTADDKKLLSGFRIKNSIKIHSTYVDKNHIYIPQNNPSVSKLVSLGLDIVHKFKPDLIWSYYVEPYGVTSLLISKISGVPYTIRHAGSDIGRLMLTSQLKTLYEEVFKNAVAIITHKLHFEYFKAFGIPENKFIQMASPRFQGDLFYSKRNTADIRRDKCIIGIYGKTGKSKGTRELLQAVAILKKEEGAKFVLKTCWGGKNIDDIKSFISELGLTSEDVELHGFIPHWKIPDFIRSCDLVVFLENNFSISFHSPGVPLEVSACGKMLLTTEEIAKKDGIKNNLRVDEDYTITPSPLTPKSLAASLKKVFDIIKSKKIASKGYNASIASLLAYKNISEGLDNIQKIIH